MSRVSTNGTRSLGMGEWVWGNGYQGMGMGEWVWENGYGRMGMGEWVWGMGMGESVPLDTAKHLSVPQYLPKVNVEHVPCLLHHDVVVMAITYAQYVRGNAVASTRVHEVIHCLYTAVRGTVETKMC